MNTPARHILTDSTQATTTDQTLFLRGGGGLAVWRSWIYCINSVTAKILAMRFLRLVRLIPVFGQKKKRGRGGIERHANPEMHPLTVRRDAPSTLFIAVR